MKDADHGAPTKVNDDEKPKTNEESKEGGSGEKPHESDCRSNAIKPLEYTEEDEGELDDDSENGDPEMAIKRDMKRCPGQVIHMATPTNPAAHTPGTLCHQSIPIRN